MPSEPEYRYVPFIACALVGLFLFVAAVPVYRGSMQSLAARAVAWVIPFPAAVVNGNVVRMSAYQVTVRAISQDQEQTSQDRALETLIAQTLLRQIAHREGVVADQSFLEEARKRATGEPAQIGWSARQFEKRIVRPMALALALEEHIAWDEEIQRVPRAAAADARARLESGESFAAVAADVSQDRYATSGGSRGYIDSSTLPASWQQALEKMDVGDFSPVLETQKDFAILKLDERIFSGVSEQVNVSSITIRKQTLSDVLEQEQAQSRIYRFVSPGSRGVEGFITF